MAASTFKIDTPWALAPDGKRLNEEGCSQQDSAYGEQPDQEWYFQMVNCLEVDSVFSALCQKPAKTVHF
jgi:hypothetical protein